MTQRDAKGKYVKVSTYAVKVSVETNGYGCIVRETELYLIDVVNPCASSISEKTEEEVRKNHKYGVVTFKMIDIKQL